MLGFVLVHSQLYAHRTLNDIVYSPDMSVSMLSDNNHNDDTILSKALNLIQNWIYKYVSKFSWEPIPVRGLLLEQLAPYWSLCLTASWRPFCCSSIHCSTAAVAGLSLCGTAVTILYCCSCSFVQSSTTIFAFFNLQNPTTIIILTELWIPARNAVRYFKPFH